MNAFWGALLPVALGIALNPASIVAVILLLTSNYGRMKVMAYVAGWLLGLMTLLFVLSLSVSIWSRGASAPARQFTTWVLLLISFTLMVMATIQWRQRPPADAEFLPIRWLRGLPQATAFMALNAGLFFGLFNMKNLLLTVAAVLIIGESSYLFDDRLVMAFIFLAFATVGVATPLVVSLTQGSRANAILADWENKLGAYNVTINCAVLVVIAIQLLLVGLSRS